MTREQLWRLAEKIRRESLNPSKPVDELAKEVAEEARKIADEANGRK